MAERAESQGRACACEINQQDNTVEFVEEDAPKNLASGAGDTNKSERILSGRRGAVGEFIARCLCNIKGCGGTRVPTSSAGIFVRKCNLCGEE